MGRVSMPQGRGSQLHNRREYEKIGKPIPDNIDVSKSSENITLVDKDIREAYREIFGEALLQYNKKQKRADRRIDDYYEHIAKSKNGEKLFYEDIIQWGKKDDFDSPQTRERAKEALRVYASTFTQRNPNLRLIGAYLHMDEASPHLHIDYVPVAHGYSRGLSVRNSLDKAMKEMGFIPEKESRKNNATKLWKDNERAYFGEICRSIGLEIETERKSERKSLTVDEYKQARDEMVGEIEQELSDLKEELEIAEIQVNNMQELTTVYEQEADKAQENALEARQSLLTVQGDINTLMEQKNALQGEIEALEGIQNILQDKIAGLKDTAAAVLLRVQERLDHTLRSVSERTRNEFTAAWAATKDISIEQALKPKRKEQER
nr:plasmid recombination protein [Bacteroides intestinalis]